MHLTSCSRAGNLSCHYVKSQLRVLNNENQDYKISEIFSKYLTCWVGEAGWLDWLTEMVYINGRRQRPVWPFLQYDPYLEEWKVTIFSLNIRPPQQELSFPKRARSTLPADVRCETETELYIAEFDACGVTQLLHSLAPVNETLIG